MIFVLIGVSAHPVWIALIFSYVFGFKLGITPIAGYCDFFNPTLQCGGAVDWVYHMLLPWATFALLFAALYTRMIRAMVIETMQEDYVRVAQAKGASSARVMRSHVLRNAMLPIVTMLGMDVAVAFGGALFIETIFDLPGVGGMLYNAATQLDLPVILAIFLVMSFVVVIANMIADIVCMVLDPRMHVSRVGVVWEGAATAACFLGTRTPVEPAVPRPLKVRARPRPDDRRLSLAVREQDRGRDREDAVARRGREVLVDVQLDEADAAFLLARELLEDRVDGPAGPAPRRPEVDDDGAVGAENLLLEVRVRDFVHSYRVPRAAARRSAGTFQIASSTIARLIFECPVSRSAKVIGTSTTRKPARSAR